MNGLRRFFMVCFFLVAGVFGWFGETPADAREKIMPDYPEYPCEYEGAWNLYQRLKVEKDRLEVQLKERYPDKPKKVTENAALMAYEKLIKDVFTIYKALEKGRPADDLRGQFLQIQRLHYSLLSDQSEATYSRVASVPRGMGRFFTGPVRLRVPLPANPEQLLGEQGAAAEARLLAAKDGRALTRADLAKLTPLAVSRLEPVPGHPAFSGREIGGDRFSAFVRDITARVQAQGKKYQGFNFARARGVLFFKELKESATTPKFDAEDRYGCTWKVKFGPETHTDVAATRLYMDLGATYTDLKFWSGPAETRLILDPPAAPGAGKGVRTLEELVTMFKQSIYKYDLRPCILPRGLRQDEQGRWLGHGQVDTAMAEREGLPASCVGAWYVHFKECQLSFYNPALKRLGAIPLSALGALDDRVARSSVVFNCWLQNRDVKDENCRLGFLFSPATGLFDQLVEFQSDQGNTFGGLKPLSPNSAKGMLNTFDPTFLTRVAGGVHFLMMPYYLPEAWTKATWADARWMALRIARLKRDDIERSLSDSGWPTFVQRVAAEKLISRRNQLVEVFALERDGIKPMPCNPEITIKGRTETGAQDVIVKDGLIDPDSPIVQTLEREAHPEGLANFPR